MGIRSAIAVESRVTSWKTSPPGIRRLQTPNRQTGVRSPRSAAVAGSSVARSKRRAARPPVRSITTRRGLLADEIDHRSGNRCQGRPPAEARVAVLGSSPPGSVERAGPSTMSDSCGRRARWDTESGGESPCCRAPPAELDPALRVVGGGGGGLPSGHTPAQRRQHAEPRRVSRSRAPRPAAAGGAVPSRGARRGHRREVRDGRRSPDLRVWVGRERSLSSRGP
jgi:hypothetical protein